MKKNHSLLCALVLSLTTLFLISPVSYGYTETICISKGNLTIRGSKKRVQAVVERINRMVQNKTFIPILDGGAYSKICTAIGYERHHLVSKSFCQNHGIRYEDAPSVLISKELHHLTGSFGSKKGSIEYRNKENEIFASVSDQKDAIYQVYSFGLDNLIDILQPEYSKLTEEKVKLMTPVKQARRSAWLQNVPSAKKLYTPTQNSQDTNPAEQFFDANHLACISDGESPIPTTPLKSSHRKR